MDAAVEFDLLENPQISPSASAKPAPSFPATLDPFRPIYTPVFPPGLGYDSAEALEYAAQGYTLVGRGFGYNPPLVPRMARRLLVLRLIRLSSRQFRVVHIPEKPLRRSYLAFLVLRPPASSRLLVPCKYHEGWFNKYRVRHAHRVSSSHSARTVCFGYASCADTQY
jgi:hypothetical protein